MFNILFLGGYFPQQFAVSIISKSKLQVQYAADTFQWAFINGLEQNLNRSIKLITAPFIGWYPKYYKDLIIRTSYFPANDDFGTGVMIGFLNLPLIKNVFKFYNLKSHINNSITSGVINVLIVYSLNFVFLKAAVKAKQKNPNVKICVIITDCYDYNENLSILNKLYLKYIENPIINNLLSQVDCFVVLTDKMIDLLKLHNKPWIRIEGIYDDHSNCQFENMSIDNSNKIVLYTGTLEYPYGIVELLDAFKLIKSQEFRLWICGGGRGAALVTKRMKEDERIVYFGIVPKEKVVELQSKATILVNPRNTVGEYNKYSFPSKTIEYLASGTPTLLYKIDGIPPEYYDYCYTVEDNEVQTLANSIYNTCKLDTVALNLKGKSAREFILKNKTAKMQCSKVLDMISNLNQNII